MLLAQVILEAGVITAIFRCAILRSAVNVYVFAGGVEEFRVLKHSVKVAQPPEGRPLLAPLL